MSGCIGDCTAGFTCIGHKVPPYPGLGIIIDLFFNMGIEFTMSRGRALSAKELLS